jgi:hypothetical protein
MSSTLAAAAERPVSVQVTDLRQCSRERTLCADTYDREQATALHAIGTVSAVHDQGAAPPKHILTNATN